MKIKDLHKVDVLDFETGSRVLKKAARKAEICTEDLTYLAAVLVSLVKRNAKLDELDSQTLDESIGILMRL